MLIGSYMLLWLTIFNSYPLIYFDTVGYVAWPHVGYRAPGYNYLVVPLVRMGSLWPVVIAQSFVMVHLLYLCSRTTFGPVGFSGLLAMVMLLAVLSDLPWIVGLVMPDYFTPVVVVSVFLLSNASNRMSRAEMVYVGVLLMFAVSSHLSHILLASGLAAAAMIASPSWRLCLSRALRCLIPIAGGMILIVLGNVAIYRKAELSPHGRPLVLARMLEDGTARRYLEEECRKKSRYKICRYLDRIPKDAMFFLWNIDSPLHRMGGFEKYNHEASVIVRETLKKYPGQCLKNALKHMMRQMISFSKPAGSPKYPGDIYERLKRVLPEEAEDYLAARQNRGRLEGFGPTKNTKMGLVAAALLLSLFVVVWNRRRGKNLPMLLLVTILLGLLGNALICGGLSTVEDRYQQRVVWLIVFFAAAGMTDYLVRRRTQRKRRC